MGDETKLDYEVAKNVYMVTLTAEDSFGASASIMVTIMVTDMDEAPEISEGGLAISGTLSVDYADERHGRSWQRVWPPGRMRSMDTEDAGWRRRRPVQHHQWNAQVRDRSLDYEMPMDAGMDNEYMRDAEG